MDTHSRPSKRSAVPPPFYLTHPSTAVYCRTCGRITKTPGGSVPISAASSGKSGKAQGSKGGKRKTTAKVDEKEKDAPVQVDNIYCSTRCRHRKPGPVDRGIEEAFERLLAGELPMPLPSGEDTEAGLGVEKEVAEQALQKLKTQRRPKGDDRFVVTCSLVEELLFGPRKDPEKRFGRRKDRASRALGGNEREWRSVDMESSSDSDSEDEDEQDKEREDGLTAESGGAETTDGVDIPDIISLSTTNSIPPRIRPPQLQSDVNGSIGGEKGWAERKEETADELAKRREGQRKAGEKEMVRRAARRCCVFGVVVDGKVEVNRKKGPGRGKKGVEDEINDGQKEMEGGKEKKRFCEAVMNGSVVEPSFAKGDWAVRWRED